MGEEASAGVSTPKWAISWEDRKKGQEPEYDLTLCFRGGNFHREPLCPGNGQRRDGASRGAAVADTVRKGEGGATGGAVEKSESRHCRHHRHHHGRSQADPAARVPGGAGALPRPGSQRKGARLVLARGAAAFGEGARRGRSAPRGQGGVGTRLEPEPEPAVGLVRSSSGRSCSAGWGCEAAASCAAFWKLGAAGPARSGPFPAARERMSRSCT